MKGAKDWSRHKVIQVVHQLMEKILGFLPFQGDANHTGSFTSHSLTGYVKDRQFQVLEGIWRK